MHRHSSSFTQTQPFISVYLYLLAGITLLVAAFLFAVPAHAQEAEPAVEAEPVAEVQAEEPAADVQVQEDVAPSDAQEPSEEPVEDVDEQTDEVPAEPISEEVEQDEAVSADDLGADDDARILPGNPLHIFKRAARVVREFAAFDPVKKAELRLEHANQELVDARRAIEGGSVSAGTNALERYEHKLEKVADAAEKLKERKEGGDARADALVERVLDDQIKQQKVLGAMENHIVENASEQDVSRVFDRIRNVQDNAAGHAGAVMAGIENDSERLAERMGDVFARQAGSDFKQLRNLEVLKRVEEQVPEQAKEAIRRAQENSQKRFVERFQELPEGERTGKFDRYVRQMGGDQTRMLQVFDEMKGRLSEFGDVPPELAQKLELAKDVAARRFQQEMEGADKFQDEGFRAEFRERALKRFTDFGENGPDVGRMRAMDDLRQRVEFDDEKIKAEIDRKHQEGLDKFKAAFSDTASQGQAQRFEELSRKMAENPDPTTFRLLQQMEDEVKADPAKREFLEKMERGAKQEFAKRSAEMGEKFFEQISSSNPQDIEVFKNLQREFAQNPDEFIGPPPQFGPPPVGEDGEFGEPQFRPIGPPINFNPAMFERAIRAQTQGLDRHLENLDDPALFENFQKKFQMAAPEAIRELQLRSTQFDDKFREKRREIDNAELKLRSLEFQRGEAVRDDRDGEDGGISEEEIQGRERELIEKRFEFEKESFEKRLEFDPFCDEGCRAQERTRFEGSLNREKERTAQRQQDERFMRDAETEARRFIEERRAAEEFDGSIDRPEGFPGPSALPENSDPRAQEQFQNMRERFDERRAAPQFPAGPPTQARPRPQDTRSISDEPAFRPRPDDEAKKRGISDEPIIQPRNEQQRTETRRINPVESRGISDEPAFRPSDELQKRGISDEPAFQPRGEQPKTETRRINPVESRGISDEPAFRPRPDDEAQKRGISDEPIIQPRTEQQSRTETRRINPVESRGISDEPAFRPSDELQKRGISDEPAFQPRAEQQQPETSVIKAEPERALQPRSIVEPAPRFDAAPSFNGGSGSGSGGGNGFTGGGSSGPSGGFDGGGGSGFSGGGSSGPSGGGF